MKSKAILETLDQLKADIEELEDQLAKKSKSIRELARELAELKLSQRKMRPDSRLEGR